MREDSKLHGVALCQQVLLVGGGPLHIHLDVHVGSDLCRALGLHHNGADVINENGRTGDAVAWLELLQQVSWGVLQAPNLHLRICTCTNAKTKIVSKHNFRKVSTYAINTMLSRLFGTECRACAVMLGSQTSNELVGQGSAAE